MKMTPRKAIDFIENEVRIDVRFCSDEDVDKTIEVFKFADSANLKSRYRKSQLLIFQHALYMTRTIII